LWFDLMRWPFRIGRCFVYPWKQAIVGC
jgi:hypothetical protein